MQWKILLPLGVFIIFEFCLSRVIAQLACTKLGQDASDGVAAAINELREKHGVPKIDMKPAEPGQPPFTTLETLLKDTKAPADDDTQKYALSYHNQNVADTPDALSAIIKKWIEDGNSYKYDGKLNQPMNNFARMLWKGSSTVQCIVCIDPKNKSTNGFGCAFKPEANLKDVNEIKANLPEPGEKTTDDESQDGSNNAGSEENHPTFEQTVRTLTLISSIATTIIVALGFVITLLVAIKIFLL